jgi:TMEM175 potassium channel family protein
VKETGRVEAFSDGVFAIAITLLVLDLKVPAQPPLLAGLLAEWPVYAAYLISFAFILIMWVNHHWMLEHIVRVDGTFMLLNGLLLLGITVVPFPTNVVAQYVLTSEQSVATAVYTGWFLMIALFFNLLWQYAARGGRLLSKSDHDAGLARVVSARYRWGGPAYLAAFVLSFIWAPAALAVTFLLAVFYALPHEMTLPGDARPVRPARPA